MKINAELTMLVSGDGVKIEIRDADSSTQFLEMRLTPEQFAAALGRLAMVPAQETILHNLDRVGKRLEIDTLEFELPAGAARYGDAQHDAAEAKAFDVCPKGWLPDRSFNSQDSFFDKDGKPWARTRIRRWVEIPAGSRLVGA